MLVKNYFQDFLNTAFLKPRSPWNTENDSLSTVLLRIKISWIRLDFEVSEAGLNVRYFG